ncbi:hypothetical protein [Vandammella animalimorsus]|uniref:hypothetical protein n=1 Tax=Vandammella animalimorsus TaxID=2029117 RepID=UPI001555907B|nr:hypothetical protein [Vandammella animalimorsus]
MAAAKAEDMVFMAVSLLWASCRYFHRLTLQITNAPSRGTEKLGLIERHWASGC